MNLAAGLLLILGTAPLLIRVFAWASVVDDHVDWHRWWVDLGTLFTSTTTLALIAGLALGVFLYMRGIWLGFGRITMGWMMVILAVLAFNCAILVFDHTPMILLTIILTLLAPFALVVVKLEQSRG